MTNVTQFVFLLFVVVSCTGCEAIARKIDKSIFTEENYAQMVNKFEPIKPGLGRVVVFSAIGGEDSSLADELNVSFFSVHENVYKIFGGTFVYYDITPGNVKFTYPAKQEASLFVNRWKPGKEEIHLTIEENKVTYVEIDILANRLSIVPKNSVLNNYKNYPYFRDNHGGRKLGDN